MSEQIKMTIPGKPGYFTTAKMAMASIASNAGFDIEKIEDLKMAVAEACKMITCHNRACWSENYDISADIDEKKMTVKVADKPEMHNIPKEQKVCFDCPREGDLGMEIIKSVMDNVAIERDQDSGITSIIMEMVK